MRYFIFASSSYVMRGKDKILCTEIVSQKRKKGTLKNLARNKNGR